MVQWISYIFASIIYGILVGCNSPDSGWYREENKIVEKVMSHVFIPAAAPTNLRVKALPYKHTKQLYLNLSWNASKGGKPATSFNIHASSLDELDPHCIAEPYYAYVEDPNATTWEIPPKLIDEASHHVSSFSVEPGCTYRVRLEANPHNGKTYTQTDYKMPDCVEDICSCWHAENLPRPELQVKNVTTNIVNITWSTVDTQNISLFILRAGPKLLHGDNTAVYNLTWRVKRPVTQLRLYHQQFVAEGPGKYAATVRAVDTRHCYGPEQQIVFTVGDDIKVDEEELFKNKVFWLLLFPFGVATLAVYMLVVHIGCEQCYRLRLEHKKLAGRNLKPRASYKSFRVKSARVFRRNDSLQERNILYVEKEIEEAKARGEVDGFEISYNQLVFLREIGRGAFGQVFLAKGEAIRGVPGSRMVAVKKLKVKASCEEREEFLEEIGMLKKVGQHPNIVSLLGCCTLKSDVCMVMEYVPCGDLLNYLRSLRKQLDARKASVTSSDTMYSGPGTAMTSLDSTTYSPNQPPADWFRLDQKPIDHRELHNFALQIAKGMAHLESKRITHRDLAARNILIDNNKVLKISDFGLSRKGVYVNTRRRKVPLRWLSVEAIRDSLYSSKSDVWAFAIVLWEIGTLGGFPYPTVTDFDLLYFLELGNRLEKPDIVSKNLYSVMMVCWSQRPDDRPSFAELVSYLQPYPDRHIYVEIASDPQLHPTSPDLYVNMAASPC